MENTSQKSCVDIKALGIPNVCFSLLDAEEQDAEKVAKQQRRDRGFDDSETWSLYFSIVKFMLPRLVRFRQIVEEKGCYPASLNLAEWTEILGKMEGAFQLLKKKGEGEFLSVTDVEQIDEGFELFHKYFLDLWW